MSLAKNAVKKHLILVKNENLNLCKKGLAKDLMLKKKIFWELVKVSILDVLETVKNDEFGKICACANNYPEHAISIMARNRAQYLWTRCQSVVPNDVPRDFGPVIAFGAKFQIPVVRQGGREVSAPRPYVTDPFHSLSSFYS